MEQVFSKAMESVMKKLAKLPADDFCIKDEIGGVHDEGIGWNPHGIFCGECSNMSCVGCANKDATE
jgi:hypothetical protein